MFFPTSITTNLFNIHFMAIQSVYQLWMNTALKETAMYSLCLSFHGNYTHPIQYGNRIPAQVRRKLFRFVTNFIKKTVTQKSKGMSPPHHHHTVVSVADPMRNVS